MEQIKVYKNLMYDFIDIFTKQPDLLPSGVDLNCMNIRGGDCMFSENVKVELLEWEVVFIGNLGHPQIKQYYDLCFQGLRLVDIKKTIHN